MNTRALNEVLIVMLAGLGFVLGCSDGGEATSQSASGAGGGAACGGGFGGGGSGAVSPEKVHAGFGNPGNANFTHDLVEATTVNVTFNASCALTYAALGPVEMGKCQTTLGMVLGGALQAGKVYMLDAVASSPADGTGYATVAEACLDAGTNKVWRSTGGVLTVDSITGKRASLFYGEMSPIPLAPDTTLESNDAVGTMIVNGYANIDLP